MQIIYVCYQGCAHAVSGPGDLAVNPNHTAERLILTGTPTDDFVGYWATSIGIFAARGGAIEWRHNDAESN